MTLKPSSASKPRFGFQRPRNGFTLIELLVVIGILLTIATLTAAAINVNSSVDQVRAGARQIQSFLEGAKSRAVSTGKPYGVRFLLEPAANLPGNRATPRLIRSMVYIQDSSEEWSEEVVGQVNVLRSDGIPFGSGLLDLGVSPSAAGPGPYVQPSVVVEERLDMARYTSPSPPSPPHPPTPWEVLYQAGVLSVNQPVQIYLAGDVRQWFTASLQLFRNRNEPDPDVAGARRGPKMVLGAPLGPLVAPIEPSGIDTGAYQRRVLFGVDYRLRLPPVVVASPSPVSLPGSVAIDLDLACVHEPVGAVLGSSIFSSVLPPHWIGVYPQTTPVVDQDPRGFYYSPYLDIMFSPRGTVLGEAASSALIQLPLVDANQFLPVQSGSSLLRISPTLSAAAWRGGIVCQLGACVVPESSGAPNRSSRFVFVCTQSGTTGTSQPSWPGRAGDTVTDGGVVWQAMPAQLGGNSWATTERLLITVRTRTGAVSSSPVWYAANGETADPFRYAQLGEMAAK